MKLDNEKIDDTILALLLLGLHDGARAWKEFDWDAMNRLHEKGLISDPHGKARSVVLTEDGLRRAERLLEELFLSQRKLLTNDMNMFMRSFVTTAFRNLQSSHSRSKKL